MTAPNLSTITDQATKAMAGWMLNEDDYESFIADLQDFRGAFQIMNKALTEAVEPLQKEIEQTAIHFEHLQDEHNRLKQRLEQSERACAEMRDALQTCHVEDTYGCGDSQEDFRFDRRKVRQALTTTAGTDYIHTSKLEELQKDKERLDWLDEQGGVAVHHRGLGEYSHYFKHWKNALPLREAIDLEMEQESKQ